MKILSTQKEEKGSILIDLSKLEAEGIVLDIKILEKQYKKIGLFSNIKKLDIVKLKEVLEEGIKRIEGDESGI